MRGDLLKKLSRLDEARAEFERAASLTRNARERKLLVHRRELERLLGKTRERGLTLVPTRLYFKGPNAKVELALARGKDIHDKRETIRRREQQREVDRALRDAQR